VNWRPGEGTAATSYAVYRLDGGAESAQLVGTVRSTGPEQSFVDKGGTDPTARYCVSGLDRVGNEGRVSLPAP
jgi:hypothetical protein